MGGGVLGWLSMKCGVLWMGGGVWCGLSMKCGVFVDGWWCLWVVVHEMRVFCGWVVVLGVGCP